MRPRYYIHTYGCQMNLADSRRLAELLENVGLEPAKRYESADLIVLYSCSVRQAAEDKVYGWGQKLKRSVSGEHKSGSTRARQPVVVLTGCMVGSARGQRKRYSIDELRARASFVDYFLDIHEWERELPLILAREGLAGYGDLPIMEERPAERLRKHVNDGHAFVKISEGCDNFCTFCVVPYGRGPEVSLPSGEILAEVRDLASLGCKWITLLGQNVNSWGIQDPAHKARIRINSAEALPFAKLLRDVHDIDGIEKISFLTANPFDFTRDLVETLALPKIDRYLHMAVQSGSDKVLARMNRKHSITEYRTLVCELRQTVPDIELGTDIIVGFPGETRDDFELTMGLVREVNYSVVYIAMYSPRPGTVAAEWNDDVSRAEKKRRHAELSQLVEHLRKHSA